MASEESCDPGLASRESTESVDNGGEWQGRVSAKYGFVVKGRISKR